MFMGNTYSNSVAAGILKWVLKKKHIHSNRSKEEKDARLGILYTFFIALGGSIVGGSFTGAVFASLSTFERNSPVNLIVLYAISVFFGMILLIIGMKIELKRIKSVYR